MSRMTLAAVAVAVLFALPACKDNPRPADASAVFFPLKPNMMWMYRVRSKSQMRDYVVTDLVVGPQYVPALKMTGAVVSEFYNLDRGGLRPIVYTEKDGYLTRLSGLDYRKGQITLPFWGRSTDQNFLPERLRPHQSWSNTLFPYGKSRGGFRVAQSHRTFLERATIAVPAGRYSGCIRIETQAQYVGGAYSKERPQLKLTYEDWYAPNVGLIRTIVHENQANGPEMDRVELIRFAAGANRAAQPAPLSHPKS